MNKLDALIDACKAAERGGLLEHSELPAAAIRRILEAVREDMEAQDTRSTVCACPDELSDDGRCLDCPRIVFRATRAALEQL